MRLDFAGFMGANTHIDDPILLADGACVSSINQAPGRGDFRPWHQPLTVATIPASPQRKTIYRMGRNTLSDVNYWLSWTTVVHAVRGFDREDTQERTYFTGAAGGPAWADNTMAIATAPYPTTSRSLGVPAPTTGPTLTIDTAGTGESEPRFYVTTFVNDLGWESAPSPPTRIDCNTDALIKLSSLEDAPAGTWGINRRRIYRTESGASGATEFFFEKELVYSSGQEWTELSTAITTDVLQTQTDLGGWAICPTDAKCLTQMWNGMAAVISGKGIRPCVANHIYAYPLDYELVIANQPVAQVSWGQNLLVLTNTMMPSVITGQDPGSLSESIIDNLPFNGRCMSETSVIALSHGAAWAGPDGLCYMGNAGAKMPTAGLIHPDQWKAMLPETMVGAQYQGLCVTFYNDGTGWKGFMVDPVNPLGIFYLSQGFQAAWTDPGTGAMFVLDASGNIKKWDADAAFMTATCVTKAWRTPNCNMGYGRVLAKAYPITFDLIADGVVRGTRTVQDDDVFSLPDEYEGQVWQVGASLAQPAITSFHVAETPEELLE